MEIVLRSIDHYKCPSPDQVFLHKIYERSSSSSSFSFLLVPIDPAYRLNRAHKRTSIFEKLILPPLKIQRMVVIKEFKEGDKLYLSVVNDEKDNPRKGTHFLVQKSLLRPNNIEHPVRARDFPAILHEETQGYSPGEAKLYSLRSVINTCSDNHFPLLGRRIISGSTRWVSSSLKMPGEFFFVAGYWEWLERILARFSSDLKTFSFYPAICASLYSYDRENTILRAFLESWCHSTNTLHTLAGELSISLWDLHEIGGLPIFGEIYDEVIPSLHILKHRDGQGKRSLSRACEHLFFAYHLLSSDPTAKRGVTAQHWIAFWCGAKRKYNQPARRKRNPKYRSQLTYNPNGKIGNPPTSWADYEESAFKELGIEDEDRKGMTHLAAFLSCWLCVFVLPQSDNRLIRPSTFEIATKMAKGIEFNLAIPVLGSIYRGLNEISISDKPANAKCFFPAHYLYGWLAHYFSTHHKLSRSLLGPSMVAYSGAHEAKYFTDEDARTLIHDGHQAKVGCTILNRNKNELLMDDGNLDSLKLHYFISLRSGYLVLRQGETFHVEPYLPSRFSRQFGYCQAVEGILARSLKHRTASYSQALRRYWQLFQFIGSRTRVLTPPRHLRWADLKTPEFHAWWPKVSVTDLRENAHLLQASIDPPKTKKIIEDEDTPQPLQANLKGKSVIKIPHKREMPINEADTSDTESDVNFKHMAKKRTINHNYFFDGVPSSDTPIDPGLGGNIDLELRDLDFTGDNLLKFLDNFEQDIPMRPTHGRGKQLQMPDSVQNREPSPSSSEQTISSPHVPTNALIGLKVQHENENAVNIQTPFVAPNAPAVTIQHGDFSRNFFTNAIKVMGDDLLEFLHRTPYSEVIQVYEKEAQPVYSGIRRLKGDPTSLMNRVDDYILEVKTFLKIEKSASEYRRSEALENEILSQKQGLKEAEYKFADLEKERAILIQKQELIANELTVNASSLCAVEEQIKNGAQALKELETPPPPNPEMLAELEKLKLELSKSRESLKKLKWM